MDGWVVEWRRQARIRLASEAKHTVTWLTTMASTGEVQLASPAPVFFISVRECTINTIFNRYANCVFCLLIK